MVSNMSIVTASAASVTSVATSVVVTSAAATVAVVPETDCEANWGMKRAR